MLAGCHGNGNRNPARKTVTTHNHRAALEFDVRQREDTRDPVSRSGKKERFQETIFEERLRLGFDGYVYHPTLLEFSVAAAFGLQQSRFEQDLGHRHASSGDDDDLLEFDISGILLQRKPYPTSFYARQTRSSQARPFLSSVQTETTGYGVIWRWVSDKTPIRLQFDHSEINYDPYLKAGERSGSRRETEFEAEAHYIFSKHNELTLLYENESIKEQPFNYQYDTQRVRLSHEYEFGTDHRHRLLSEVEYFDQTGSVDSEWTEWRETLTLQHTERFQTMFQTEVADRKQGMALGSQSLNETSYRLSGTLTHRLYDNFETQLNGFYQEQDFDSNLVIRRKGGTATFRYFRHIPWGVFRTEYRARIDTTENDGETQIFEVIDEARTFLDPAPIVLNDPRIELGTIRILREDRTRQYEQGIDYRLRPIANRVEIERIPTGRIQNEETVLITYRFRFGSTYNLKTVTDSLNLRMEFDGGWTPYFRYLRQRQSIKPTGSSALAPEDIRSHLVGIEYRKGTMFLSAEYEDYDSSLSPFRALRFNADYSHTFKDGSSAGAGAHWSDLVFSGGFARRTRLLTVDTRYQVPISPNLFAEASATYRNEKDSLSGDYEGIEVDLGLEWQVRKTRVTVDYRYATFKDDFAHQGSTSLFVHLRRRL